MALEISGERLGHRNLVDVAGALGPVPKPATTVRIVSQQLTQVMTGLPDTALAGGLATHPLDPGHPEI